VVAAGTAPKTVGVRHLVYGSAGIGKRTGVRSWDSKLAVEEHLAALGLAVTVLRPMAFMELMTDNAFRPAVSTWYVMPKLMGSTASIPWLAVEDLGASAVKAFADPERFAGRTLLLAADVRSIDECRAIWTEVRGRAHGPRAATRTYGARTRRSRRRARRRRLLAPAPDHDRACLRPIKFNRAIKRFQRTAEPPVAPAYRVRRTMSRPPGLYFHVIAQFPQRPWLELAVGVRRRGSLVTHHIEFPWPGTHSEPYEP
jgi:hypothetical protein